MLREHWLLFWWLSQVSVQIKWGLGLGNGKCQSDGSLETVPQRQVEFVKSVMKSIRKK